MNVGAVRNCLNLCAVFGDEPLQLIPSVGWYYRLRVNTTSTGWVGGFGIGVTLTSPGCLDVLPERAARVPLSWLAGYWGRTFSNGQERPSMWKPQSLKEGDEVGFLVDVQGECSVFVNDEERCRFSEPGVPVHNLSELEITPLIDVASAVVSVTFLIGAPPPPAALPGMRGASLAPTAPPPSPTRNNSECILGQQHTRSTGALPMPTSQIQALPTAGPVAPCMQKSAAQAAQAAAAKAAVQRVPQLPLRNLRSFAEG